MSDAETNIIASMNTANDTYNKAEENISSNTYRSNQIADVLVKVEDMATNIDNTGARVSDIEAIFTQAKAIAENAVTSATES